MVPAPYWVAMSPTTQGRATRATSRVLFGREEELGRLQALYADTVRDSRPAVVIVEGEAGIGKTRLAHEFMKWARGKGADVLVGACVELTDEVLPYAPMVEILGDLVRREGTAVVTRLAGPTAAELARLVPTLTPGTGLPEVTRASAASLFQALCSLIEGLARVRPLVLVIEDVQWADSSTRDMVTLLAQQVRSAVLVLLTVRSDELPGDPPLRRFTSAVSRGAGCRVVLEPLGRNEQARQIGDILGVPPTTRLVDAVYSRAEGNPFFAEELLAFGASEYVPWTVRHLLITRLETFSPATQQVLRAASVVGRRVPHRLLGKVADVPEAALEDALRPAVAQHVLLPDPTAAESYLFRHALVQETVESTCLPGESARLHRRLAQALADTPALAGDSRFVMGRVARHWHAAGDASRALVASLSAAREAEQGLAFDEALAHYERTVSLLDMVPEAEELLSEPRYQVLWSAAEAAHLAAFPERAAELVREALTVVDLNERHHHAYLHERLGRYLWMAADGQAALQAYERAMELIPTETVTCWRAATVSGYAQALMLAGRFAESADYARDAIRMAREVDKGRSTEGHARNNLGVDLAFLGHLDEGIAELIEARQIAEEEFDDVDDIARAIVNLHSVLLDHGRLQEAADVALEGIPVVDGLGLQRRKGVWCRCDAAQALLMLGRIEEALDLADQAWELSPDGIDAVRTSLVHGQALLRMGDLVGARSHLERTHRTANRIVDGQILGPLYTSLVELATWERDLGAAIALAEEGTLRLLPEEDPAYCLPLFAAGATAAAECSVGGSRRRSEDTHRAAAQIQRWVSRADHALARSPAANPMAAAHHQVVECELARARGRSEPGAWGHASALWEEVGDPYRAAFARLRETEALLRDSTERPAARQTLRSAWGTARAIGASRLQADMEDLAGRARLRLCEAEPPSEIPAAPYRLTPREVEVLRHVAEGSTDRQIGERLFISHRTVERHVSNLLAKLGAARRAELAVVAHRTDLLSHDLPGMTKRSSRARETSAEVHRPASLWISPEGENTQEVSAEEPIVGYQELPAGSVSGRTRSE